MQSALERAEADLQAGLLRWFAEFLDDLTGFEKGYAVAVAKEQPAPGRPLPGFVLARLNDSAWWQTWSARLAEALTSGLLAALERGGQTAERQLQMKLSWDYLQPAALDWARQQAAKLVMGITPDLQAGIARMVTDGLSTGKTVYQIRDEIAALKNDKNQTVFPQWRATRIARTEVIRAHAQGAALGYKESGVVRGMKWLDGQSGACPKCRELHNKTVKLGEKFYNDPTFGDGLPPRHPHCRCAIAALTLDQVKHLPADHPLRDNRRNSIEEVTDLNAYAEINGVRVTGERLRHAKTGHSESTPRMAEKLITFIGQGLGIQRSGKFNDTRYYVQDEQGKWWVVVAASGKGSLFMVTFHRVHSPPK